MEAPAAQAAAVGFFPDYVPKMLLPAQLWHGLPCLVDTLDLATGLPHRRRCHNPAVVSLVARMAPLHALRLSAA